ncbi:MAG TPA: sigma-70 family RNA polymerase sigma factor, partial [Kineosporiaceae bacterium]|nr:sigma-70 family RNA polymerase sigma factor [Kineosporiaceae bacterium]
ERYSDVMFRCAYRMLGGDNALAQDVHSEAWFRIARGMSGYQSRGEGSFARWALTITKNIVRDHRRRGHPEVLTVDMLLLDRPTAGESPEQRVVRVETARVVAAALGRLRAPYRDCLILRFYDGLSLTDCAAIMGTTIGAMKVRQHRAIKALAAQLPPEAVTASGLVPPGMGT